MPKRKLYTRWLQRHVLAKEERIFMEGFETKEEERKMLETTERNVRLEEEVTVSDIDDYNRESQNTPSTEVGRSRRTLEKKESKNHK